MNTRITLLSILKVYTSVQNVKVQAFYLIQNGGETRQNCGLVVEERLECLENYANAKFEKDQSGLHTGMPSTLAQADKGLSTLIPYSSTDVNGSTLSPKQRQNMQRIIRWNKISSSNRSYHRNLKNAFSVLLRIRDKLSLSDPVTEKAAYYYRKVLDLNVIKGRSIKGFVDSCSIHCM